MSRSTVVWAEITTVACRKLPSMKGLTLLYARLPEAWTALPMLRRTKEAATMRGESWSGVEVKRESRIL